MTINNLQLELQKEKWKCEECGSDKKYHYKTICSSCYMKKWTKENPDKVNKSINKYRKNNPHKRPAWSKARRGIGKIEIKGLCRICKKEKAKDRHHPDYSKPRQVILVCKKCHKEIHKKENGK